MGRAITLLFVLTIAVIGVLYALDIRFPISEDEAVQRELRRSVTTAQLDARVAQALDKNDIDDATVYAGVAAYMNRQLSPQTQARLTSALSTTATIARNATGFAGGFITGEGGSTAAMAGALTSDVTVVGDVRDIGQEGGKLVAGQSYNRLVLGLSVLGVAATVATVATGGGGVVARLGASTLKIAARAGTLTADFVRELTRLVDRAVNAPELARTLRTTNLNDITATESAVAAYARSVKGAEIFPVLGRLGEIGRNAGPAETVKLLRYVHTTEDVENIAGMSAKFGKKTRGIVELTGRTALRAFKTSLNIVEFLIERVLAFGVWILGLLGLFITRRLFGRRTAPAHA